MWSIACFTLCLLFICYIVCTSCTWSCLIQFAGQCKCIFHIMRVDIFILRRLLFPLNFDLLINKSQTTATCIQWVFWHMMFIVSELVLLRIVLMMLTIVLDELMLRSLSPSYHHTSNAARRLIVGHGPHNMFFVLLASKDNIWIGSIVSATVDIVLSSTTRVVGSISNRLYSTFSSGVLVM